MHNSEYPYIHLQQQLRDHFLKTRDTESFSDLEILELLLLFVISDRNVKPLAKKLLEEFEDLGNIIYCDKAKIKKFTEDGELIYAIFLVVRELIKRLLKEKLTKRSKIGSYNELIDYLKFDMGKLQVEQLRVLFLNNKNFLIKEEILSIGTVDHIHAYPRNIVKLALDYAASAIILIHNHPSGISDPSDADIALTDRISQACKTLDIKVHDHIIITNDGYFSFKNTQKTLR